MIFTDTCKYEGEKYFEIPKVIFLPNWW
jgi:hypothetical protein